jgi:Fic family protein
MKKAFVPPKLPPNLQDIYTPKFILLLGQANRALARLGQMPNLLPDKSVVDRLAAPLLKKEAILSSKIEGTQTTLSELYKYEAEIDNLNKRDNNRDDVKEVENYVNAMHAGMEDIKSLSLSIRTIKNMHLVLLSNARSEQGVPGEFRTFDAYIAPKGTPKEFATYIAAPPEKVADSMASLEEYINSKKAVEDPLIQCALLHYQFEAIHPFGDGNGRIGRLLIPLFFYYQDIVKYPFIYISEYFERNHDEYYERLLAVSEKNDWKGWIEFFLKGIISQSDATCKRGESIIQLYRDTHALIKVEIHSSNAVSTVEHIFRLPYTAAPLLAKRINVAKKTARELLDKLLVLGVLTTAKGRLGSRPVRVYVFKKLIDIING